MSNDFNNVEDKDLLDNGGLSRVNQSRVIIESVLRLKKSVDEFDKKSSEQTGKMIALTGWIIALTIVMIIGLTIQIFLLITGMQ